MRERVRKGMIVRSTSGEKLGKVAALRDEHFVVEKGVFFPADRDLHYQNVRSVAGDEIVYDLADTSIAAGTTATAATAPLGATAQMGARPAAAAGSWQKTELAEGRELRVPLMEEQVSVEKKSMDAGEFRIHKEVVTEERKVTVPLKHEEVIVERVRSASPQATTGARAFQEERFSIPVHEEQFEVTKRPVIKEEVVVRRVTRQEERPASVSVRHEEIEIEDATRLGRGSWRWREVPTRSRGSSDGPHDVVTEPTRGSPAR